MTLRPEVLRFAENMEKKLREHDDRPGWKDNAPEALLARLRQETDELDEAIASRMQTTSSSEVMDEAADVANFCMMIHDVYRISDSLLRPPTPLPTPPVVRQSCGNCRYFSGERPEQATTLGSCRRYPHVQHGREAIHPVVHSQAWCGEWHAWDAP